MRSFFIIVSLVNLCFLSVWRELIFTNKAESYWLPSFEIKSYLAAILNVVGLSIMFWGFSILSKKWSPRIWKYLKLGGLLFGLIFICNYLRKIAFINSKTLYWLTEQNLIIPTVAFGLIVTVLFLCALLKERTIKVISGVLIILFPFTLLMLAQTSLKAIDIFGKDSVLPYKTEEKSLGTTVPKLQRIIWIIFDELDLRLAFTNRPDNVILPEFDQLRSQSLFATEGFSHSKSTREAIPSFLMGKIVASAVPTGPATLRVKYENSSEGEYSFFPGEDNFFSDAYDLGSRTAIIGMYHPYWRLFVDKVSFCSWYALNTYTPQISNFLLTEMFSQMVGILPLSRRINAISTYKGMLKTAKEIASNPSFDVLYIHASVPHGPDIYHRDSGRLSLVNFSNVGYFDNLVLADQYLGKLRRSMESAGLWDTSTVVVTSDHEWRFVHQYDNNRVRKVPFLIKMAHQSEGLVYETPFSPMLIAKDLLLQILSGNLNNIESVVVWLDNHSL